MPIFNHQQLLSIPASQLGQTSHTMAVDKKRKRSEGQAKRPKAAGAAAPKRQKSNAGKRVTSVNSLSWKSVEVPEMFDDAEGFYGLEEVEGVEIVRDGNTVKFVSFPCASGRVPKARPCLLTLL